MTGPGLDADHTGTMTFMVTFFADLRRFLPRGADGPALHVRGATIADLLGVIGVRPTPT